MAGKPTQLAEYVRAKAALERATDIHDVLEIRDKAEALRKFAKARGAKLEAQNLLAEIRIRGERKAGKMLDKAIVHKGGRPEKLSHSVTVLSLDDLGISRDQSSRWQLLAGMPLSKFDEQVEARQELVDAYRDQQMAKLFEEAKRTGWTQQELADQEGKSQKWADYHVRFGAYLNWIEEQNRTARSIPKNLTEYRFRLYWQQTSGTKDTARFRKVLRMMQDESVVHTPRTDTRVQIEKPCRC